MAKKLSYDKDKDGVKYKFPERSCEDCTKYPCIKGMQKLDCNLAKYGCTDYKQKV